MAKAVVLHDEDTAPAVPKAAETTPPVTVIATKVGRHIVEKREPLQVRWPAADVKAIKRAALDADQTVSDYMLACFHAHMHSTKHE